MSYILDAIKKSEAERNQGVSPGALASPTPVSGATPLARIATAIVVLNVAALGGWWWWQGQTPATATMVDAVPTLTQERPPPAPDAARPTHPTRQRIDRPAPTLVSPPMPVAAARPTPAPDPQARLPEFSTHVFADDPELRAVTLDGRRLTEGDLIGPGIWLLEITESGVVLDFDGERVEFDVLQDWRS